MLVTASLQPGSLSKPASSAIERASYQPVQDLARQGRPVDASPHFTMISTITPGSFADAYHVLRNTSPLELPAEQSVELPEISSREIVILSGAGVPGAIAAYSEVNEAD